MRATRGFLQRRRIRELSGDTRAGSWARGRARTAQRAFLRDHWRLYAGVLVALYAVAVLASFAMPSDFLKGLVFGSLVVAGPAMLWNWTVQATGTAPVMMGDLAEQWSAADLRKLARSGWRLVNHFALAKDDIDHVLVGPGGVFAVETKWSASSWHSDYGQARLRDAINQSGRNARALRLWHPFKSQAIPVHPAVVLWGGGTKDWDHEERIRVTDGVTIVTGAALNNWIRTLGTGVLTEDAIATTWAALDSHAARRDPADQLNHPLPPSAGDVLARIGLALACAIFGLVTLGWFVRWTESVWWSLLLGAGSLVPALVLARVRIARPIAWGWLSGVALPGVALAIWETIYGLS